MKTISKFGSVLLMLLLLNIVAIQTMAQTTRSIQQESKLREKNRKVINAFYVGVENQKFDIIKEVFAENAKQLIPYAPDGFPKSLNGSDAIYKQFSGLTAYFVQMKFPRQIFSTEDPNFFFVKFKGDMDVKGGGKYENDYIGTFKFQDGKIVEYAEYFNPIVMAKAFNIKLD